MVNSPSYDQIFVLSRLLSALDDGLTRIKSHAHPGLLPIPSIFTIAAANRPEKADAMDTAENIIDVLVALSVSRGGAPYNTDTPQLELPPRVEGC